MAVLIAIISSAVFLRSSSKHWESFVTVYLTHVNSPCTRWQMLHCPGLSATIGSKGAFLVADWVPLWGYLTWGTVPLFENYHRNEPRTIGASGNYYFHAWPITVGQGWFLRRFPFTNGTSACCLYLVFEPRLWTKYVLYWCPAKQREWNGTFRFNNR